MERSKSAVLATQLTLGELEDLIYNAVKRAMQASYNKPIPDIRIKAISINDAAEILRVSTSSIYKYLKEGRLERRGKRITVRSIENFK